MLFNRLRDQLPGCFAQKQWSCNLFPVFSRTQASLKRVKNLFIWLVRCDDNMLDGDGCSLSHCFAFLSSGWMLWQDPVIGGQEGKRQLFRPVSKECHDRPGTQHHRLVENGPLCIPLVDLQSLHRISTKGGFRECDALRGSDKPGQEGERTPDGMDFTQDRRYLCLPAHGYSISYGRT